MTQKLPSWRFTRNDVELEVETDANPEDSRVNTSLGCDALNHVTEAMSPPKGVFYFPNLPAKELTGRTLTAYTAGGCAIVS